MTPKYLIIFFKRIAWLLLIYSTSRLFLFLNNTDSFVNVSFFDFLEGFRFDISSLLYINIPIFLLLLIPTNHRIKNSYQRFINIIFYVINIPFIVLNNIDIEYFKFTQKRSTIDFFQLIQLGSDAKNIIPQYMSDYWLTTLLTIIQIWFLLKVKNIPKERILLKAKVILSSMLFLVIGSGILIIGARGGLQLKPIKPINAGEIFKSNNSSLILNTPFCILHSYGSQRLLNYNYYSKEKIDSIYSPLHQNHKSSFIRKNVIILIMEGLSREFIGAYNDWKGYTPFLDSLMHHSLVFNNAFANGLKSIEALPAITASIPTLMDNPLITSSYAQNNFESLASILKKENYRTSFFHGGIRGTQGFYSFSRKTGFEEYHGMEEYGNNSHFDGTWGIFDEEFFQYYSDYLKAVKKPFFSTFFSVSFHSPYIIPNRYKNTFPKGTADLHEVIGYVDYSMRRFFDIIKKQEWYKNTIFVITADHTNGDKVQEIYKTKIGRYAVPIIIFEGDSSLHGINNKIVQQIDIMPTILDLLCYNKPFFAFGKSMLNNESWAISFLENKYCLITEEGFLVNKGETYNLYTDWSLKSKTENLPNFVDKLKAIKQEYNLRMINNNLNYEN